MKMSSRQTCEKLGGTEMKNEIRHVCVSVRMRNETIELPLLFQRACQRTGIC